MTTSENTDLTDFIFTNKTEETETGWLKTWKIPEKTMDIYDRIPPNQLATKLVPRDTDLPKVKDLPDEMRKKVTKVYNNCQKLTLDDRRRYNKTDKTCQAKRFENCRKQYLQWRIARHPTRLKMNQEHGLRLIGNFLHDCWSEEKDLPVKTNEILNWLSVFSNWETLQILYQIWFSNNSKIQN